MTGQEKALLNKIFRATHDRVCAKCGSDMTEQMEVFRCVRDCGFVVTFAEMRAMESIVAEWGKEAVKFFEKWRLEAR